MCRGGGGCAHCLSSWDPGDVVLRGMRGILTGQLKPWKNIIEDIDERYFLKPSDIFVIILQEKPPQDSFEPLANGAVNEEVDGGVDGEEEVVGAGQAQVPKRPYQGMLAPGLYENITLRLAR